MPSLTDQSVIDALIKKLEEFARLSYCCLGVQEKFNRGIKFLILF